MTRSRRAAFLSGVRLYTGSFGVTLPSKRSHFFGNGIGMERNLMHTQALAYLRVSGRGQIGGDGFPRQRAAIERHAARNRMRVVEEFRDEGVSGASELADRPGLAALLDGIESNGVNVVLIERADRLARDLIAGELILGQLRELGVRVISADGGAELTAGDDDPTRKLIRQVLGAVAEFDKSVTVAKLRAARERRRRAVGRCEGRKPFGHYPGEAATLGTIKDLRRKRAGQRTSYAKIAERLNDAVLPTRTGKPWIAPTVRRIVQREWPTMA